MGISAIGEILATIAVKFLQAWLARVDLRERAKLEIALEIERVGHAAERRALEWKVDAISKPGGGSDLRVQPGGGRIELSGTDSTPPSKPNNG